MAKVSIIIATYNSGKTLRKALESVRDQDFQDWECIVVDGASKDNTLNIVKEYVRGDSRFRYISEPDKGIYDAFNKGWQMANSEWIHYLGSDDRLTTNGLKELVNAIDEDSALIVGNTYIEKPWGEMVPQYAKGRNGCHQSMITKKSVIEILGGFDETFKILADEDLRIRIEKKGYKIKNVQVFVSYFALNGVSQNFSNRIAVNTELYKLSKRYKSVKYPIILLIALYCRDFLFFLKYLIKRNHSFI